MTYNGHVGKSITQYSKSIVALLGSVLTALVALTPIVSGPAQGYLAAAVVIGTGISTYLVRNTKTVADLADEAASLGYSLNRK